MTELDELAKAVVAITVQVLKMPSMVARAVRQKSKRALLSWKQRGSKKSQPKAVKHEQRNGLDSFKLWFEEAPKKTKKTKKWEK